MPDAEQFQKLHSCEGLLWARVGVHVLAAQAACAHHRRRFKSAGMTLDNQRGGKVLLSLRVHGAEDAGRGCWLSI